MTIKPADLEYAIMPARFCNSDYLGLFQKTYEFWRDSWTKVFAENRAAKKPNPDEFFRQDFITVVRCGEEIAAVHFYSLFDFRIDLVNEHPYVKVHFNAEFVAQCRALGYFKLMSMESLFANPEFRKSKTGVGFTEVMGALGQLVFLNYTDADAVFSPTRSDNKTSQSAQVIGFWSLQSGVMVHNTPIDMLVCGRKDVIPAPDPARFFVEYLWRNRQMAGPIPATAKAA